MAALSSERGPELTRRSARRTRAEADWCASARATRRHRSLPTPCSDLDPNAPVLALPAPSSIALEPRLTAPSPIRPTQRAREIHGDVHAQNFKLPMVENVRPPARHVPPRPARNGTHPSRVAPQHRLNARPELVTRAPLTKLPLPKSANLHDDEFQREVVEPSDRSITAPPRSVSSGDGFIHRFSPHAPPKGCVISSRTVKKVIEIASPARHHGGRPALPVLAAQPRHPVQAPRAGEGLHSSVQHRRNSPLVAPRPRPLHGHRSCQRVGVQRTARCTTCVQARGCVHHPRRFSRDYPACVRQSAGSRQVGFSVEEACALPQGHLSRRARERARRAPRHAPARRERRARGPR